MRPAGAHAVIPAATSSLFTIGIVVLPMALGREQRAIGDSTAGGPDEERGCCFGSGGEISTEAVSTSRDAQPPVSEAPGARGLSCWGEPLSVRPLCLKWAPITDGVSASGGAARTEFGEGQGRGVVAVARAVSRLPLAGVVCWIIPDALGGGEVGR